MTTQIRTAEVMVEHKGSKNKSLKFLNTRVLHLDDTVHTFKLPHNASGADMYVQVIRRFIILESDYFDLEFVNEDGIRCWMDHTRPLVRQITHGKDFVFRFCVKFYTPHPNLLEEEYTRYLFALQIKRDLVFGSLICSENTSALLASYIVQAEIGDFIKEEYHDISYLQPLKILHEPNDDRLKRVMEFHKSHIGLSPTEADFALLDTSRKVEFYGVRLHSAKDSEGLPLSLAVTHLGIGVFQNFTKINTFSWAKIRKLSFKRKRFLVKLHSMDYDIIEFCFECRDECKRFWKKCIEHHAFFRCPLQERSRQRRPRVVTKGSSFRYIGRTQKELIRFMHESILRRPPFERPSTARRAHPTLLTGPNYSSARMGTTSMTLRAKSMDRRQISNHGDGDSSLIHGMLGSSRFLDQTPPATTALKRAHSSFVPNAAQIGQSTGAVATSGYSTMGGSSSCGALAQSNEKDDDDDDNESLEAEDIVGSGVPAGIGSGRPISGSSFDGKGPRLCKLDAVTHSPFMSAPHRLDLENEAEVEVSRRIDDFDGPPGSVTSVPLSVLTASPRSSSAGPIGVELERAPPKPVRSCNRHSTITSEFSHGTMLRRQASLAEHSYRDHYNYDEKEAMLHAKYLSSSVNCKETLEQPDRFNTLPGPSTNWAPALCGVADGSQEHQPTDVDLIAMTTTTTTSTVLPHGYSYTYKPTVGMDTQEYIAHREIPYSLQHAYSVDMRQTQLPVAMELLDLCRCKSTSTQTVQTEEHPEQDSSLVKPLSTPTSINAQTMSLVNMEMATKMLDQSYPAGARKKRKSMEQARTISSSVFEMEGSSTQIVGIDQWSSSGTESTTGVILRAGASTVEETQDWKQQSAQTTHTPPECSKFSQHSKSCSHRAVNLAAHTSDLSHHDESMTGADNNRMSQQVLPLLSLDTLPARCTPRNVDEVPQIHSFAYGFSRSIPSGVHLAGLSDNQKTHEGMPPANWKLWDKRGDPMPTPFVPASLPIGFMNPTSEVYAQHSTHGHPAYFEEAPCLYMPHPPLSRVQDLKQFHQRPHMPHMHHNHPHPPAIPPKEGLRGSERHHHHHSGEICYQNHPNAGFICSYPEKMIGNSHHSGIVYGYPVALDHNKRSSRSSKEKQVPVDRRSKPKTREPLGFQQPRPKSTAYASDVLDASAGHGHHHDHHHHHHHGHYRHVKVSDEEQRLCKLHSSTSSGKPRQQLSETNRRVKGGGDDSTSNTRVKSSRSRVSDVPVSVSSHRDVIDHGLADIGGPLGVGRDLPEPNILKRKLVQSPALGEKEEFPPSPSTPQDEPLNSCTHQEASYTRSISSPPAKPGKQFQQPVASKEYGEKVEAHKASIEALKRELRSVETASAVQGKATPRQPALPPKSEALRTRGSVKPPVELMAPPQPRPPSDEAAARLADPTASTSFSDVRGITSGTKSGEEVLLKPPQDTLYLESDTASSLEHLNTVRRSPMIQSKHFLPTTPTSVTPDLVPGYARSHPKAPSLSLSSSASSSSSSSSAGFSRTQSLFSQGAILSNASSISRQSSDSEQCSSDDESIVNSSREHFMCHECVPTDLVMDNYLYQHYPASSRSHRPSNLDNSKHRSLSRHGRKGNKKETSQRSKSSHTLLNVGKTDSQLLKSILTDELALETINRQQKMLKRELAKQQQLIAELTEARHQTQLLLEEKAKSERLQNELPAKVEVNEMLIKQPSTASPQKSATPPKQEEEFDPLPLAPTKPKNDTRHHSRKHRSHHNHHRHRSPSGSSSDDEVFEKEKVILRSQKKSKTPSQDISVKETEGSRPTSSTIKREKKVKEDGERSSSSAHYHHRKHHHHHGRSDKKSDNSEGNHSKSSRKQSSSRKSKRQGEEEGGGEKERERRQRIEKSKVITSKSKEGNDAKCSAASTAAAMEKQSSKPVEPKKDTATTHAAKIENVDAPNAAAKEAASSQSNLVISNPGAEKEARRDQTIRCQSKDDRPPPPPTSPPPPSEDKGNCGVMSAHITQDHLNSEHVATVTPSTDIDTMPNAPNSSKQPVEPVALQHEYTHHMTDKLSTKIKADEKKPSAEKTSGSLTIMDGLAGEIISEVWKDIGKKEGSSGQSSPTSSSSSSSSIVLIPRASAPTTQPAVFMSEICLELSRKARLTDVMPHRHEIGDISSLEPVPEGRIAESYSASRSGSRPHSDIIVNPVCSQISTYLPEGGVEDEAEHLGSSEGSDFEEPSSSSSASEGSEDIEPFPLPPPDLIAPIPKGASQNQIVKMIGHELHEVEEEESGSVYETTITTPVYQSAPFRREAPMQLSHATEVSHPIVEAPAMASRLEDVLLDDSWEIPKSAHRKRARRKKSRNAASKSSESKSAGSVEV